MANQIKIRIPQQQPDRHQQGQDGERRRQSYCCLGVYPHEGLKSKGIVVSATAKAKTGHRLHRVCDDRWETWWEQPNHCVTISKDSYRYCRLPYESRQQLAFHFKK